MNRRIRSALANAVVLAAAAVPLGGCGGSSVPAAARPVVDRFVTALELRRYEDLYAAADEGFRADAPRTELVPVLDAMDSVLGRRLATGEPAVARSDAGGSRLAVEVPVTHERGACVLELEASRDDRGRWAVSHCAARSAAFEWVLR